MNVFGEVGSVDIYVLTAADGKRTYRQVPCGEALDCPEGYSSRQGTFGTRPRDVGEAVTLLDRAARNTAKGATP